MSTDKSTALTTTPVTRPIQRHDGWTIERQSTFLRALAASHSVKKAAKAAGMSRQSAYGLRARLKGEPFDLAWNAALRCRFDALAEAAMDRALNGVEVPHFYKGELIGTSRRYDERLTVALLAMQERFRGPHRYGGHPADMYEPQDFGPLLERVESGPETWRDEIFAEIEQEMLEDGADGEDEFEGWEGETPCARVNFADRPPAR